jgi:hypothetical protein
VGGQDPIPFADPDRLPSVRGKFQHSRSLPALAQETASWRGTILHGAIAAAVMLEIAPWVGYGGRRERGDSVRPPGMDARRNGPTDAERSEAQ